MKNVIDVFVDLETLALERDAVIASVGAVAIERGTGEIASYHDQICTAQSMALGFKSDVDTVKWWDDQSEDARAELLGTKQPLEVILYLLDWFHRLAERGDLCVWGNGIDFDLGKLKHHFAVLGYSVPWDWRGERDVRTAVDLGLILGIDPKSDFEFIGVKHNALHDARHQARYVTEVMQAVKLAGDNAAEMVARLNLVDDDLEVG